MSISVEGAICFGFVCGEGCGEETEFPWDEEFDGDIDEWWRHVKGYQPLYKAFTAEGNYAEGWHENDPRFKEYFDHRFKWVKDNPLPVALLNCGSSDCPMYVIAVPNLGFECEWGYPTIFEPSQLEVSDVQINALKAFLDEYDIDYEGEPQWLLISYSD